MFYFYFGIILIFAITILIFSVTVFYPFCKQWREDGFLNSLLYNARMISQSVGYKIKTLL